MIEGIEEQMWKPQSERMPHKSQRSQLTEGAKIVFWSLLEVKKNHGGKSHLGRSLEGC